MSDMQLPRFRIGPWLPEGAIPDVDGNYLTLFGWPDGLLEAIYWNESKARAVWQKHANHGMRFAPILRDEGGSNTVRVRAACAVTASGTYSVIGWQPDGSDRDNDMIAAARGAVGGDKSARVSFIEADVPLPEWPRTVEGEVTQ